MKSATPNDPPWLVARLGDDLNWWIEQTGDDELSPTNDPGLLDPQQLTHLLEVLAEYQPVGYHQRHFNEAFQLFVVAAEIAEGSLRLAATDEDAFDGGEFFARPRRGEDGEGPYAKFLDTIAGARIRLLNQTHRYAQPCTVDEMFGELDAIDTDRYLNAERMHVFDEINEILQWSPAEWDEPVE
jgi:hypothetical protein